MKFTKMQGCGNDYIYVNCFNEQIDNPSEMAKILSGKHFGVGADGLILIKPSEVADFSMGMYNADGSEGTMCGNGIRCIGKYVYDNEMTKKTDILVETKAGVKALKLHLDGDKVIAVTVDMGEPILKSQLIPVNTSKETIIGERIKVGSNIYEITCVSMGNPHAVLFVDDVSKADVETVGKLFEINELFPEQINTEFVQVLNKNNIAMRVWERGSGETLACGTGACASVVAAVLNGKTENKVFVKLLGGYLEIWYDIEKNKVFMTGPAVKVFDGEIQL